MTGRTTVDRIAILVSYEGTAKFLGAPKINAGSGKNIAETVYNQLIDWKIADKVVACSFDTTASNTGLTNGACVYLNQFLGRELILLGCRHHIHEIILKNVYEILHGKSSAPETLLFNRFASEWEKIKLNQFKSGVDDSIIRSKLSDDECNEIMDFCVKQLELKQIRGDYKELLQLTVTFLGGGASPFQTCGATSHARFMSKCIYSLKIFLFRDHFNCNAKLLNSIRTFLLFVVKVYIKAWYGCTNAIKAPMQDMNLLREAYEFAEIDRPVSQGIIGKLQNHLWYLTSQTVALAFFDADVSIEIKTKMVNQLKAKEPIVKLVDNRKHLNPQELLKLDLSDFVSHKTKYFF